MVMVNNKLVLFSNQKKIVWRGNGKSVNVRKRLFLVDTRIPVMKLKHM